MTTNETTYNLGFSQCICLLLIVFMIISVIVIFSGTYSKIPLTHHAKNAHKHDKWNATTIKQTFDSGKCKPEINFCLTREFHYCEIEDGVEIGLVIGRSRELVEVIVTGFAAPTGYWENCGD